MADSNIGALPLAPSVADDSQLVMEQQGQAMRLTGKQLKEYAKQGVELEFQEALDEAKDAADRAAGAVSSVVDMTVDARTLENGQSATVTKTMRDGKVNLSFGLPRGAQGVPGPEGKPGPAGPQGPVGAGLDIAGRYDTTDAVPYPQEGKSYYIGTTPPYDVCTYLNGEWVNNGPLSGGGGGSTILPENVVTAEGGAVLEFGEEVGDTPRTILFTVEEDPPLTAAEIEYNGKQVGMAASDVQGALEELFTSVSDGKSLVASAVTDKGVPADADATFAELADKIGQITTGGDTSDATATPGDILAPKTAYTASGKVTGIIPSLAARTIMPGTQDKTIANGQYLAGTQTIKGDSSLTPANIRKGVTLFGVAGAMESSFKATLTVTADIGAVVTATCEDTSVEGLSTSGTVVLELPIEGTWKVTAVRGVAQYNTVTLEVSSSYSASLTAEVHVEYYGTAEKLSTRRHGLAAAALEGKAMFGGGKDTFGGVSYLVSKVDYYDQNLTHGSLSAAGLSEARFNLAAARAGDCVLFAGGRNDLNHASESSKVDAYDGTMTAKNVSGVSRRSSLAGTTIGGCALFGGGTDGGSAVSTVEAYDEKLAKTTLTPLALAASGLAAASNENYAVFGGGALPVTAYDKSMVRSTPAVLSSARTNPAAARAGNYVLIAGGYVDGSDSDSVDAYDLFLTRTMAEPLKTARRHLAGTTLKDYAVFGGGYGGGENLGDVDVYDAYLTRTRPAPFNEGRNDLAAASVGDFALFGGGYLNFSTETVDVYHYT